MAISITIQSKRLGQRLVFVAREASGYVYLNPGAATWGQQVFERDGSAAIARTEAELRRVARRYIARVVAV